LGPRFFFSGHMTIDFAALTAEVRRRVDALGYELVDLRRGGSHKRPILRARIDRPDSTPGHGVTVDDCAYVSRKLEAWLDAGDVLGVKYVLEVSSPGIERPIRWPEHWQRFRGHDVYVKLPEWGRVRATIVDVDESGRDVVLRAKGKGEITVAIEEALDATLAVDWH
jgi:ribosome maturation factor RimP